MVSANFATTFDGVYEPAAGGNGTADTAAAGDDVQLIALNGAAAADAKIIGPGPNGVVNSVPAGDDLFRLGHTPDGSTVN